MAELPVLPETILENDCEFCRILKTSILDCSHWFRGAIQVCLQLVLSPEGRFVSVLAHVRLSSESRDENAMS